jgi:two-component system chemotaxis sensor kinase CheA
MKALVEQLRGAMARVDPGDLPGLAGAHGLLQQAAELAASSGFPRAAEATGKCADRVEEIILEADEAPVETIEAVRAAIDVLAAVVEGSIQDPAAEYPAQLGVSTATFVTPATEVAAEVPTAEEESDGIEAIPVEIALPEVEDSPRAKPLALPDYVDEAIFDEFLSRQPGVLADLEHQALQFEREGSAGEAMQVFRRLIHTLKGEAGLLAMDEVEGLCHLIEDVLDEIPAERTVDTVLGSVDWLQRVFKFYAGGAPAPESPDAITRELKQLRGEATPAAPALENALASSATLISAPPARDTLPPTEAPAAALDTAQPPIDGVRHSHPVDKDLLFQPGPLTADLGLLGEFVAESREHLQAAEVQLLNIETSPEDMDALNAVFRAFHTIKGVAGFLDLPEIGTLAHVAEELLDQARKGQRLLTGGTLDIVFESVDCVSRLLDNIQAALAGNSDLIPDPEVPGLGMAIRHMLAGHAPAPPPVVETQEAFSLKPLGQMLVDSGAISETTLEAALAEQAALASRTPRIGEVLRGLVLLSSAQLEAALDIQQKAEAPKVLGEVLVDLGLAAPETIDYGLACQAASGPPKIGEILIKSGAVNAQQVRKVLSAQRRNSLPDAAGEAVEAAPDEAAAPRSRAAVREPVKVDAHRLDQLIDMIGELVIAESMVTQFPGVRAIKDARFSQRVSLLDKITRELQEMATGLRMVPARATFQKMSRIVRDVAKKSGKEVVLHTSGEDTELDKTVIDRIGDPLVHMVRNAVDHGLEATPEDRCAAGKAPVGNIYLRAFHQGGYIHVQIEDDGRGLDHDAILAKARERGLLAEGEIPSEREIAALIFEPGFSTAKVVSEISGRGVGMDVVKKNITDLRGRIEIDSKPGQGSTFTIILPLTLAIIDGMVIRVGRERLIIPTLSIVVSLRPRAEDLISVLGEGEMFKMQGMLYPLVRVYDLFGFTEAVQDPVEGIIVVAEINGRRVGLLVDEILGQQQTVIKSLGAQLRDVPGIAGGAIMPDGRVGLILDVQSLLHTPAAENAG